jgi:very-short-patch-repair endonuclease
MRGPKPFTTDRARLLRQVENDAEESLWRDLRGRRLNGFKFVRQMPMGPYFADFACREVQLIVEIDGRQHVDNTYDRQRDRYMALNGWNVVRFWNTDVLTNKQSVLSTIVAILEGRLVEAVHAYDLRFVPAVVKR